MKSDDKERITRETLAVLIGLGLTRTRGFCATRHFYFGEDLYNRSEHRGHYTLGVECPWRIEREGEIIVGSHDYYVEAEGNVDPNWTPGNPTGHLQDQRLRELLGESTDDGSVVNVGPDFIVEYVEADECGGFRVTMTGGWVLAAFPSSSKEMEWILLRPGQPAVILIDGRVAPTERGPGQRPAEGGE